MIWISHVSTNSDCSLLVLKPLSQIGGHRRFGGTYCLHFQSLSYYGCCVVVTIVIFCVILTGSLVAGYQLFGGKKCLLFQGRSDYTIQGSHTQTCT